MLSCCLIGERVPIPERIVLLLSGIPCTGKSSFARYLAHQHNFAHYDMECYPRGWPRPELKETWDTDRTLFIAQLRKYHHRTALDWGFPVACLPFVNEVREQDVRLIWFDGDIESARKVFIDRKWKEYAHQDEAMFDRQVRDIQCAGYPDALNCLVCGPYL
jgi:hypothetical protein